MATPTCLRRLSDGLLLHAGDEINVAAVHGPQAYTPPRRRNRRRDLATADPCRSRTLREQQRRADHSSASCTKATRETRTRDLSFTKASIESANPPYSKNLSTARPRRAAPSAACGGAAGNVDPDLSAVIQAWPDLPDHLRMTIRTLIESVWTSRTQSSPPICGRQDAP